MKRIQILCLLTIACLAFSFPSARAADPEPALPKEPSPFDKNDPEIAMLRKLPWKEVDFNKLDLRSRTISLLALNSGLNKLGTKADGRLELLMDYIDEKGLGAAYLNDKDVIPDNQKVTYEDMKKVAAAYVATPVGAAKYDKELPEATDDLLHRYLALYDKTSQRAYSEAAESRHEVRSMGLFLQKQGKLDDFKTWAGAEKRRRQEEHEREVIANRATAEAQELERRQRAVAAAEQRRQEEQERSARMMQEAIQYEQSGGGDGGSYADNDSWWGDSWSAWDGAYYYGNQYRGYVRDKLDSRRDNWAGRPSQLPARPRGGRGGGGRR